MPIYDYNNERGLNGLYIYINTYAQCISFRSRQSFSLLVDDFFTVYVTRIIHLICILHYITLYDTMYKSYAI